MTFLVSVLRVRYRRRAAQRAEGRERARPIVGALKLGGGLGFASLVLASAHGSLAVGMVVAGLILAVAGVVDLAGRDRVGFWIGTVSVLVALAIYLVHAV